MSRIATPRRTLKVGRVLVLVLGLALTGGALFGLHRVQVRRHADVILARARTAADSAVEPADFTAAGKLFKSYLNFRPRDPDALTLYAETLERAPGRPARELVGLYEKLRSLDSLSDDQRRRLARHYLTLGNAAAARDTATPLAAAAPDDPDLLDLLAACDESEGEFAAAADKLQKAVGTKAAPPESYTRLADLYRVRLKVPDAAKKADAALQQLVADKPTDRRAWLTRSAYYARAGDYLRARADAEHAYRTIPGAADDPDVALALAVLATAADDLPLAREALGKAIAARPTELKLKLALADLQTRAKDPAAARATLAAAAAGHNPLDVTLLTIADRLIDLDDAPAAAVIAERFAADPAAAYAADYLNARMKLAAGDWPEAAKLFTQAAAGLGRMPALHGKALVGLADAHALAGDAAARRLALTDAARIDPQNVQARVALSALFAQSGKTVSAAEALVPVAGAPAARAALCELRLAEQLARPEPERDWRTVDAAAGPEPHPPEVAVVRANAFLLQGRSADAVKLLADTAARPDASAIPGVRVALAAARGVTDPNAGLQTLDQAKADLGDRADFRLARAALLLRGPTPTATQISTLADNADGFPAADRARLRARLAPIVLGLGDKAAALALLVKSAADNRFDLGTRVAAVDLAATVPDPAVQRRMLDEIKALDGADGPVTAVAEATVALRGLKPGETQKIAELRTKVEAARAKRDGYGPAHVVLGALAAADGQGDAATNHFRRAVDLGERSDEVVRAFVNLLLARQGQAEALQLLSRLDRSAGLPPDLAKQLTLLRATHSAGPAGLAWAGNTVVAGSDDYRDHLARCAVFESAGQPADARKAAEKAVGLANDRPEAWLTLVRLIAASGPSRDARDAADAATKALPRTGSPAPAATNALALGVMRELAGPAADAEPLLREADRLLPNDPAITAQLAGHLRRTGRPADARAVYKKVADAPAAPPEVKRWANRNLALDLAAGQPAPADHAAALALVDQNLKDGGDLLADVRAKALVLATDPLKVSEAVKLLTESAKQSPLTADESYYLGLMLAQEGRTDLAESALRDATRGTQTAAPEHLAALVRLQLRRANVGAARESAARLKAVAPNTWDALAADARVTAAGRPADAAKLIIDSPLGRDPVRSAPLLEELGLLKEAEDAYRRGVTDAPGGHAGLVAFLARARRPADAATAALDRDSTTPHGLTARLLAAAVHAAPPTGSESPTPANWPATLAKINDWLAKKLTAAPNDPDLALLQAELLDRAGKHADALRTYEKALAANPDADALLNNAAMLYALVNHDGGSRPTTMLERLVARQGHKAPVLDTRAVVHLAGNRPDEAARDLLAATGVNPGSAVYQFHLALAHDAQPDKPDATSLRNQALAEALRLGLTRDSLHPLEWPAFDRLRALRK